MGNQTSSHDDERSSKQSRPRTALKAPSSRQQDGKRGQSKGSNRQEPYKSRSAGSTSKKDTSLFSDHGNAGYRVKNLHGTTGCRHYSGYSAAVDSSTKCAVHGCSKFANRACHVIAANQSADRGKRKLVYMCPSHNSIYDEIINIRVNAKTVELPDCKCGWE